MFTFKGIHASYYNVVVNLLPPFKKASKKVNIINIEGKDGTIVEELGYEGYVLPCKITLMDMTKLDEVMAWLSGSGALVRDDDDTKKVNVSIYNEVSYQKIIGVAEASFEFYVSDPFRYLISESDITLTANGTLTQGGTVFSEPLIKLTGTGLVEVTINGRVFSYNFDTSYVYLDSKLHKAYYLTNKKNRKLSGNFPILDVGLNTISWTGNITEMVITKRTRYL